MAKSKVAAPTTMTPRMLGYFHFEEGMRHVIAWLERPKPVGKVLLPVVPTAVHLLRSDETRGAVYERRPGTDARYLRESSVQTRCDEFQEYLKERLLERSNGQAPKETYELLGVEKPAAAPVVVSTEVAEGTEELYRRCAEAMKVSIDELRKKYEHLNPGLQAMNLRNRLRARGQVV